MKVLKWIGIIIVILLAVFVIAGLILPKEVSIKRSITIDAPKDKVYAYVASFEKFEQWSPWSGLDSNLTYEITDNGEVGGVYSWEGNKDVGKGKMTTTYMDEDSIAVDLKFEEPFEDQADTYYLVEETNEGTKVSWGFSSHYGFPLNALMAVMGMKGSVSKDFDRGLGNLKEMVESAPEEAPFQVEEMQMEARTYLVKKGTVKFADMPAFYENAFGAASKAVASNDIKKLSMPTGIFYSWDQENEVSEMAAGMQIDKADYQGKKPLTTIKIGPGKALKIEYYGAYGGTGAAHNYIEAYMNKNGYTGDMVAMEEYVTDPGEEPDTAKWLTNIFYVEKGE